MRLDLREVIHTPGAVKAFAFPLDLSQLEFYGQFPIIRPVEVEGRVVNRRPRPAGAGVRPVRPALYAGKDGFAGRSALPGRKRGRRGRTAPPGERRAGFGRGGGYCLCAWNGHQKSLLRRLQRAVRQVWSQFESRALPVQAGGGPPIGGPCAAAG